MKLTIRLKGGPGSGNFDHAGRPGKEGGSASGSSGGASVASDEELSNAKAVMNYHIKNVLYPDLVGPLMSHADVRRLATQARDRILENLHEHVDPNADDRDIVGALDDLFDAYRMKDEEDS